MKQPIIPDAGKRAAEKMFWPGSLGDRDFTVLVETAASGGFNTMAISPLAIHRLLQSGRCVDDILAEAQEKNIKIMQMDGVSSWAPIHCPASAPPGIQARFAFSARQCLDMAKSLGLQSMLIAGAFEQGALPLDVLVKAFADFCDAAAERHIDVDLEFVSFWGIPDLPSAWEIIRQAERPNGRILIDTWHLQKGSNDFERDMRLLASIPAEYIRYLQIADAPAASAGVSLYAEGRFRCFPGGGVLDIGRMVQTVATGGVRFVGMEIFGKAIDELSPSDAGQRCADAVQPYIQMLRSTYEEI
ncbi:MAG: sugar phosphate isomerase/epimerase [Candidatus Accumulibacter sp.]|jgi:sugar phosphate isomerase/epimerase|nr:sugar phosphate isomerase/epimerase [Accumulibacter sp.]